MRKILFICTLCFAALLSSCNNMEDEYGGCVEITSCTYKKSSYGDNKWLVDLVFYIEESGVSPATEFGFKESGSNGGSFPGEKDGDKVTSSVVISKSSYSTHTFYPYIVMRGKTYIFGKKALKVPAK